MDTNKNSGISAPLGKPKRSSVDLGQDSKRPMTDDEKIDLVAAEILKKYRKAFEELAK